MQEKKLSKKQKQAAEYYVYESVTKRETAEHINVSPHTISRWFKQDEFIAYIAELEECRMRLLEQALRARAVEKSDTLGIFFMKADNPEKYDDNIRKERLTKNKQTIDLQLPPIVCNVIEKSKEDFKQDGH